MYINIHTSTCDILKDKNLSCVAYKTTKTITYKCSTSFLHLLLHPRQHNKIRLYRKWIILAFNTTPSKSLDFTYCKLPLKVPGSKQPRSQVLSPTRRETLVGFGHVSPRIWEITNKQFGEGADKCEICLYKA